MLIALVTTGLRRSELIALDWRDLDLDGARPSLLVRHGKGDKPRRQPLAPELARLSDADAAAIVAAMKDVQRNGLRAARHLRGDVYEVRADGDRQTFRILFAPEGQRQTILLALDGFSKKTQRTPPAKIALAERRLADWRSRAK